MGSAKSIPVSPPRAPPHNKHQLEEQTLVLLVQAFQTLPSRWRALHSQPYQQENSSKVQNRPRTQIPTLLGIGVLDIAWIPMKTGSEDPQSPLVKELSEVADTEASQSNLPPESILPLGVPSSFELGLPLDTQLSLEDQLPPWNDTEHPSKQVSSQEDARYPTETPVASQSSDKPSKDEKPLGLQGCTTTPSPTSFYVLF
uniref:Uncharacterized protein n=1 Tax=Urocitellus parryii TaxID=9999 RepID=A0A8D2HYI3_UROPR